MSAQTRNESTEEEAAHARDLKARYERGRVLLGEAYALLVLDDRPIPRDLWGRITREIGEYLDATEAT